MTDVQCRGGTFADGWRDLRGDSVVVKHALPAFFGEGAPDFCLTQEYRIAVKDVSQGGCEVQVLAKDGSRETSDTAGKILSLLYEQLK